MFDSYYFFSYLPYFLVLLLIILVSTVAFIHSRKGGYRTFWVTFFVSIALHMIPVVFYGLIIVDDLSYHGDWLDGLGATLASYALGAHLFFSLPFLIASLVVKNVGRKILLTYLSVISPSLCYLIFFVLVV